MSEQSSSTQVITLPVKQVKMGDYILRFDSTVKSTEVRGNFVRVTFTNGRVWKTNAAWNIAVRRAL